MRSKGLLTLIAVALGCFRIWGYVSMPFPAIAHVFVGWMLGTWWTRSGRDRFFYLGLAVILSVVEVVCFVHFGPHP